MLDKFQKFGKLWKLGILEKKLEMQKKMWKFGKNLEKKNLKFVKNLEIRKKN